MIVLFDKLSKQPLKLTLTKHDHMVTLLSQEGSNESLHIRIPPRTSIGRTNFRDAAAVQKRLYTVAIDAIIVPEEILGP
ncbi:MAG: hypothetical protein JSU70_02670 [Phycisphaerales bacterium]|nr:MAG: hypothetical protein JSU70_02670 [Phycisphaerales bacterium]